MSESQTSSLPVLLVIDVQMGIDDPRWGVRNNPALESNLASLLAHWRAHRGPIVHVRHAAKDPRSSYAPGGPGYAYKPEATPLAGEMIVTKDVSSAFIATDLEGWLRRQGHRRLAVAGVLINNSVDANVRHAANLGFDVLLIADATAAVAMRDLTGTVHSAATVHAIFSANLAGEYATIVSTAELIGRPG